MSFFFFQFLLSGQDKRRKQGCSDSFYRLRFSNSFSNNLPSAEIIPFFLFPSFCSIYPNLCFLANDSISPLYTQQRYPNFFTSAYDSFLSLSHPLSYFKRNLPRYLCLRWNFSMNVSRSRKNRHM